jgi:hypothetical protein
MTSTPRYRLGRDLTPIDLTPQGVCLEGRPRLRPGHVIELTGVPSVRGPEARQALVESWAVANLGNDGPIYRGTCRWLESSG